MMNLHLISLIDVSTFNILNHDEFLHGCSHNSCMQIPLTYNFSPKPQLIFSRRITLKKTQQSGDCWAIHLYYEPTDTFNILWHVHVWCETTHVLWSPWILSGEAICCMAPFARSVRRLTVLFFLFAGSIWPILIGEIGKANKQYMCMCICIYMQHLVGSSFSVYIYNYISVSNMITYSLCRISLYTPCAIASKKKVNFSTHQY
jgi:hypothetical protein